MHRGRSARSAILASVDFAGASTLARLRDDGPRIVLYHGVTRELSEGIFNYRAKFITPEAFAYQVAWMKLHFEIMPLRDLVDETLAGRLHKNAIAVTFDDGYANNFEEAFPILRSAHVPATFFVTTGFLDGRAPLAVDSIEYALGTNRERISLAMNGKVSAFSLATLADRVRADLEIRAQYKTLASEAAQDFLSAIVEATGRDLKDVLNATPYKPMTWEQAREMERAGMTFAAHTVSHPLLSHLSETQTESEIADSTARVRAELAAPIPIFAYPNGRREDVSESSVASLKKNGYHAALTTISSTIRPHDDPFLLPRFTLDGTNEPYRFRLAVSGALNALARAAGKAA